MSSTMQLVTRSKGERIELRIGDEVVAITVVNAKEGVARLMLEAPDAAEVLLPRFIVDGDREVMG